MCEKLVYLICFVLVLGLFGSVAQASPLVYEPFDYVSIGDSLNGQSGDAIGLSGAWVTLAGGAVNEFLLVDDLGPYGVLPTAGNAVKRLVPARSSAHRPIDGSITFPSTTWFSFLFKVNQSDMAHSAFIISSTPLNGETAQADLVSSGHAFGFNTHVNDPLVRAAIWSNSTVATLSSLGLDVSTGSDIRFIVGKIEFDRGGSDIVTLYDVATDLVLPHPFATVEADADQSLVNMISIHGNREVSFDEIRIGGTLRDVLGLPSHTASGPNPFDQETDVPQDTALSWTPGEYADKHDVYFGADFNDVNDADRTNPLDVLVSQNQDPTSYSLAEVLQFSQTYYWRIDEVNAPPDFTVFKGNVWSFTTEPLAYPIANITATASSSNQADTGPENAINASGLDANDLHSKEPTDMWLSGAEPLGAWIEFQFDKVYKLHEMWVWNSNQMIESALGLGLKDVSIEYSVNGTDYTPLGTTAEFARAPGLSGYAHNTTIDMGGVPAKHVRLTATSNWGGIMPQYGLSEVRFFYIPVNATKPYPASGATGVNMDVVLGWHAGREAVTHDVYVSTDEQAVIDRTAPVATVTEARHGPLSLDLGVTHYWRVDEVNEAETPTTWESNIWSLTVADHIVVDDFESYNDLDPDDPESNRIFNVWIDGYGIPANGSIVGYDVAPFAEQTIVHGGKQSMPFFYANTGGAAYSEAELPLSPPQDWTAGGAKTLSLWFLGDVSNTAAQLYVKVNGSKVTYDGDASNLALTWWQAWNIDLASSGASLQNVTKLAIGIDGNGAAGTLYFDDIRLYARGREFVTPSEPDNARLIGHWKFDGDMQDSSGRGNHGTAGITPAAFVAGRVGSNAMDFRGADYVVIDSVVDDITSTNITLSAWVQTTQSNEGNVFAANDSASAHPLMFGVSGGNPFVNDGGDTQFPPAVNDDQWHLLTYVRDGSQGYVYVDGFRRGTYSAGFSLETVTRWSIGQEWDNATPSNFYTGAVDDARIYDYSLSAGEVAWLAGRTDPFDKPF